MDAQKYIDDEEQLDDTSSNSSSTALIRDRGKQSSNISIWSYVIKV